MSNPDSFIDEVTEEVRRDRLFAIFRKYGWIGAVLVALIVGGAAWNEWQKSRETARAQAFGDAMLDAMDLGAPEDRVAAVASVPVDGSQAAGHMATDVQALFETSNSPREACKVEHAASSKSARTSARSRPCSCCNPMVATNDRLKAKHA